MRFRPEQHLRRPGEIRAVREQGRRLECRAFTIWWKRRDASVPPSSVEKKSAPETADLPRVCVIASTAAVGAATRRNRAKRRLREIFRQHQHAVPTNCDLLLIARSATNEWPLTELEKKFTEACQQIAPAPKS